MSLADKVREYAYANYIKLAKDSGKDTVTIKSGDIHDGMCLENQIPSVCGALDTKKFQKQYNLELEEKKDPACGVNVY